MGRRDRKRRAKRIVPESMLVREGFIQNIVMDPFGDGRMRRCIPSLPSHGHARSFIAADYWATGARPCRIGSIRAEADGTRETLETVIAAASLADQCEYAAVMEGATADGGIRWRLLDIRPETLGLSAGPDLACEVTNVQRNLGVELLPRRVTGPGICSEVAGKTGTPMKGESDGQ